LRIKAHRLGKISDIIDFLNDLEKAYNSIYAFDFLVDTLSNDQERRNGQNKERIQHFYLYLSLMYRILFFILIIISQIGCYKSAEFSKSDYYFFSTVLINDRPPLSLLAKVN